MRHECWLMEPNTCKHIAKDTFACHFSMRLSFTHVWTWSVVGVYARIHGRRPHIAKSRIDDNKFSKLQLLCLFRLGSVRTSDYLFNLQKLLSFLGLPPQNRSNLQQSYKCLCIEHNFCIESVAQTSNTSSTSADWLPWTHNIPALSAGGFDDALNQSTETEFRCGHLPALRGLRTYSLMVITTFICTDV